MVYKINCPVKVCDLFNPCYVGYTQNTINKRLSGHLYNRGPRDHMMEHHNMYYFYKNKVKIILSSNFCFKLFYNIKTKH